MEEVAGVYPRTRVKMQREKQGLAERREMGDNKRRMNREHAEAGKNRQEGRLKCVFLLKILLSHFYLFIYLNKWFTLPKK